MVKFVDVPLDVGNAERAVSELNAALADSSNARRQEVQTQEARPATTTTEVDPRFAGNLPMKSCGCTRILKVTQADWRAKW